MTLRFGTDGVRGVANTQLTPAYALALGAAAADVLGTGTWLVGRDTRRSGPMIEAALAAGLCSAGADVVSLGVAPTPMVARLAAAEGGAGVAISASHNPFADNGLKVFAAGGRKLTDAQQADVEAALAAHLAGAEPTRSGADVGVAEVRPEPYGPYVDQVVGSLAGRRLDGLHVVLDCAHGAATPVAPRVFEALGASVDVIGHEPDGTNINDGVGSTAPGALQRAVVDAGADLGLAFDGDADRLIAADDRGELIDGDRQMALFGADLRSRGELVDDTIVLTVMSNLGLRLALAEAGVQTVETAVGDRYVLEALEHGGYSLGGEQSGHLIFPALSPTGDGIQSGVLLADLTVRTDGPISVLAEAAMQRLPQVLVNVPVAEKKPDVATEFQREIEASERSLGDTGRVLLRPSGTEPLVRVMVEAADEELARAVADNLAEVVSARYGRHPSR